MYINIMYKRRTHIAMVSGSFNDTILGSCIVGKPIRWRGGKEESSEEFFSEFFRARVQVLWPDRLLCYSVIMKFVIK